MSNKIIIGLVIILAVAAGAIVYFGGYYRASPPGSVELTNGDLTVSISYSRPSVRGRLIFGTEQEGALLPYGKYWRLGANEATEIMFNKDVTFNGRPVKAGTYSMYAVPEPDTFDVALNSEVNKSGSPVPNHSLDVLHTDVPVQKNSSPVEKFTISLEPEGNTINIIIEWANTRIVVPVS